MQLDGRAAGRTDRRAAPWLLLAALLAVGIPGWIVFDLAWHGAGRITLDFLLDPPADAGRAGGIGPILVSTAAVLAVCVVTALPLAIGTAVFTAELPGGRGRLGHLVGRSLELLASAPSILMGLFGNALFCHALGMGFSILAGGLTLACMTIPVLARTTHEALRAIPFAQRRAAAALGLSRTTELCRLSLPAAAPAILAGLVLAVGRALAETAALIFTSGYVSRMPSSLWDSGRTVSVHVYDLAMNVPGGDANARASALLLIVTLIVLHAGARAVLRRWRKA